MKLKKLSLVFASAFCFVLQTNAQNVNQYDDIYFDGEEEIAVRDNNNNDNSNRSTSSEYDDESFESESVASNDYQDYRVGENYDPYDYEYASRMRRFHNSAPGFSYYSNYYVDAYYYDPCYSGTSIYIVNGPTCWNYNTFGGVRWWMTRNAYHNWHYGYGYAPYAGGGYAYNNGFWDGYYAAQNPWCWRGRNNFYGQNGYYYTAATPAATSYVNNTRYVRGANTGGRSTTMHRTSKPYSRSYAGPRSNTSSTRDTRGNAYTCGGSSGYGSNPNRTTESTRTNTTSTRNAYTRRQSPNSGSTNNSNHHNHSATRSTTPSYNRSSSRSSSPSYKRSSSSRSSSSSSRSSNSSSRSSSSRSGGRRR